MAHVPHHLVTAELSYQELPVAELLLRVATMASTSQSQKGRDAAPSTLDADIEVLGRAKGTCQIPLAQVAFESAGALLTTIRVRSHLFHGYEVRAHVHSGLRGRKTGLLRTREVLRRCVQNP